MTETSLHKTFTRFLTQLQQCKSTITIDVDRLLDQFNNEEALNFLKTQPITQWITSILDDCDKGEPCTSSALYFALRLLTVLCSDSTWISRCIEVKLLERIAITLRKQNGLQTVQVKLAHIQLLRRMCEHSNGFVWFRQWKMWRYYLNYEDTVYTVQMLREQAALICDAVVRLEDAEAYVECAALVECLIMPASNKIWYDKDLQATLDSPNVKPTMVKFHQFMEYFFLRMLNEKRKFVTAYYILIKFNYQNHVWQSRDVSFEDHYTMLMLRNVIIADFVRLTSMEIPTTDSVTKPITLKKFTINFFNTILFCISRYLARHAVIVAELFSVLWARIRDRRPDDTIDCSDLSFGDQVLMIQLMPILFVIKERTMQETGYLEKFMQRLFSKSCPHTTRTLYGVQEVMMHTKVCATDLACRSIKGLVAKEQRLSRERAILVFHALVYVLTEYLPGAAASTKYLMVRIKPQLLSNLLTGIHELLKNYAITWSECLETTSLVNTCMALLSNQCISGKLSNQVLSLIQLSIEHFTTPNMVLLVDTLDNSGLENLGPCIMKCLDEPVWEVRDSAMQLIASIADIAREKYPTFQKFILSNDMLPVVVHMAKHDCEAYVRVTALKCISTLVKVPLFKEKLFQTDALTAQLICMIYNEEEAIVRRQAVDTFRFVFIHQGITEKTSQVVFSTLAYAATHDLDWEVKLNAVKFWATALEQNFIAQGWRKEDFPEMVFSKEDRKIVRMDDPECASRLFIIIQDFAYFGGLGVLLMAANDEDVVVAETAVRVIQNFLNRLKRYKYIESRVEDGSLNMNLESSVLNDFTIRVERGDVGSKGATPKRTGNVKSEQVLDAMDIDGISGIVLHAMETQDQQHKEPPTHGAHGLMYKKFAAVSEEIFLNLVTKLDLQAIVDARRKSFEIRETLDTILGDLIETFGIENCDVLDCY